LSNLIGTRRKEWGSVEIATDKGGKTVVSATEKEHAWLKDFITKILSDAVIN